MSMEEIYQQYAKVVYGFLLTKTHDSYIAEELTQETFFQAIRSIDRFDGSCKVSTWLCAIARNVLLAYHRKNPTAEELPDSIGSRPSSEEEVLGEMNRLDLIRLIHRLPEPSREVVYLRVFGDLSFANIGEIHGKSENWARVTFFRAKEKLRKDVEQ
jgi:RNA polymerase sigma-70 factor (ECF subfamily)